MGNREGEEGMRGVEKWGNSGLLVGYKWGSKESGVIVG